MPRKHCGPLLRILCGDKSGSSEIGGAVQIDGKQAASAVFQHLGPQGRTRTHKTDTPGQLDFSTGSSRGCIIHDGTVLTDVEVRHILQRHHADNAKGKALMLFTTAAPQVRKRAFLYIPIYLIGPGGIITPWNRRARILAPLTPQQQTRRRVLWGTVLALVAVALVAAAVLVVTGDASGLVRSVGIAVLVVAVLAIVGVVGAVLDATGVLTRLK